LYAAHPVCRKYGVYLLPAIAGQLSKPPALVFPLLLFAYVLLIESRPLRSATIEAIPALLASLAMAGLQAYHTPATFSVGPVSPFQYRITQPFVALRYFGSFFLPLRLSADTDLAPFTSAFDPLVAAGFAFLAVAAAAAVYCCRRVETRPVAFGLWWFLAALAPTSLFPLAEVENDHRMLFPFAGLAIGVVWAVTLAWPRERKRAAAGMAAAILMLGLCGWGVHLRNEVWRSEATLWRDVTTKSPRNGRGLMNYGLSLMAAGDATGALDYFQRALPYTPNYSVLEINLGIVYGELHNDYEAERHFKRAVALTPEESLPYHYYARWLDARNRRGEALANARKAVVLNPSNPNSQSLLHRMERDMVEAEQAAAATPTAETYLNLSFRYHQAQRYADCIRAAREALARKPDLAEAYNNMAAAYEELGQWDQAIEAATAALRLKPDFPLARNNLAWALSRKSPAGAKSAQ
jgi:tetratricopeptide (TPR) repeat protein